MTAVLRGEQIGRWTVIGEASRNAKGQKIWPCRCLCGTEREVLDRSLRYGGSESCGCLHREKLSQARANAILPGQAFGDLTVLRRAEIQRPGGVWWTCRCACGQECDVLSTLLITGKKTHCGCKTYRGAPYRDVTGQTFGRLTALYPTDERSSQGGRVWHCRCECGNEVDVAYNELLYTLRQSCGCQKRERNARLQENLTHVAGTSVDYLRSKKIPSNNTTGAKGVYLIRGKYTAKIVFQKKAYYLGSYDRFEDALRARQEAEQLLGEGTVEHYQRWKERAEKEPAWAAENPIEIQVSQGLDGALSVTFLPEMESKER